MLDLEDAQVSGSTGCNRLAGAFALGEDELRFGPLATTRMACAEEVMQRETQFLDTLARVTSYELDRPSLALLHGENVVATLEPRVPPGMTALR